MKRAVAIDVTLRMSVPGENQCPLSLEITQTTQDPMGGARLHCQLVAALQARAMAAPDPDMRKRKKMELEALLEQARKNARNYVSKGCQKICQKRMSEDTPEEMPQRTSLLNGLY